MNVASSAEQRILQDPHFPSLKQAIIERTGLDYYHGRNEVLAWQIHQRLQATRRSSCAQYLQLIKASEQEFATLTNRLTVGETFFFRYPEQFDLLREKVIPSCLEENRHTKRLRIWSAGCSTGAEPYSLSILLQQHFAAETSGWRIEILATDLNSEALERAKARQFSPWELRSIPQSILQDCFKPVGNEWQLKAAYGNNVRFEKLNLLHQREFPSGDFDIIFCRNVMIYFNTETTRKLLKALHNKLTSHGWFFVGHAEPHFEIVNVFCPVNFPVSGVTLYRKSDAVAESTSAPAFEESALFPSSTDIGLGNIPGVNGHSSPPLEEDVWTPPILPPMPRTTPLFIGEAKKSDDAALPRQTVDEVRQLADSGNWSAAADRCDAALSSFPTVPALHCYRALIHEHEGQFEPALEALRRAIYLERNCTIAHYHLGRCLLEQGAIEAGIQSLTNALETLSEKDDEDLIDGGDGLTVANLREFAEMHLQLAAAREAHEEAAS